MYTELRKAFTGEPYKANEDLDAALLEIERLRKDAERYAWLKSRPIDWSIEHHRNGWATTYARNELDAAIDKAMKGQP